MKIEATNQSITEISADAIVVGIWDEQALSGAAAELNRATNGTLEDLIESKLVSAGANKVTKTERLHRRERLPSSRGSVSNFVRTTSRTSRVLPGD